MVLDALGEAMPAGRPVVPGVAGDGLRRLFGSQVTVSMPPYSASSPADASWIGQQIGNWGGEQTNRVIFDLKDCTRWAGRSYAKPTMAALAGITHFADGVSYPVYPTGVKGIGYVIGLRDPNSSQWTSIKPPETQVYPAVGSGTGVVQTIGYTFQVKLVATGQLKTGSYVIPASTLAMLRVTDEFGRDVLDWSFKPVPPVPLSIAGTTIDIASRGCSVTRGVQQTVDLPYLSTGQFKGVGTVPDAPLRYFNIHIECDTDVAVHATMTDASDPGNVSNILSLAKASTASGVGLQVFKYDDPEPLSFGPDSSARGNTNQWFVGNSTTNNHRFLVPFSVRYIQTAPKITGGKVEALSTVTFSYQ
ncbi:fimbrial protein [Pseudomonas aeruginosa]|uniref:fimbrial protein n=1 Tax=Pseudomonas aeruginosa TaxID=287 RepID=UPI00383B50BC